MKLVRCNKCGHEYYICEELSKLDFPIGREECGQCGATDYTMVEDDVRVAYNNAKDDINTQQEDIKHSLELFKEELKELVETYLEPFLK